MTDYPSVSQLLSSYNEALKSLAKTSKFLKPETHKEKILNKPAKPQTQLNLHHKITPQVKFSLQHFETHINQINNTNPVNKEKSNEIKIVKLCKLCNEGHSMCNKRKKTYIKYCSII